MKKSFKENNSSLDTYPHRDIKICNLVTDLQRQLNGARLSGKLKRLLDDYDGESTALGVTFTPEGKLHSIEDWSRRLFAALKECFTVYKKINMKVHDSGENSVLVHGIMTHLVWLAEQTCENINSDKLGVFAEQYNSLHSDMCLLASDFDSLGKESAASAELVQALQVRLDEKEAEHLSALEKVGALGEENVESAGVVQSLKVDLAEKDAQLRVERVEAQGLSAENAKLLRRLEVESQQNAELNRRLEGLLQRQVSEVAYSTNGSVADDASRLNDSRASSYAGSFNPAELTDRAYQASVIAERVGSLSSHVEEQRNDIMLFLSPLAIMCVDMLRLFPRVKPEWEKMDSKRLEKLKYRLPKEDARKISERAGAPEKPHIKGLKLKIESSFVSLEQIMGHINLNISDLRYADEILPSQQLIWDQLALLIATERMSPKDLFDPDLLNKSYMVQMLYSAAKSDASNVTKETISLLKSDQDLLEKFNEVFAREIGLGTMTPRPSDQLPEWLTAFLAQVKTKSPGFTAPFYLAGLPSTSDDIDALTKNKLSAFVYKCNFIHSALGDGKYLGEDAAYKEYYIANQSKFVATYKGKPSSSSSKKRSGKINSNTIFNENKTVGRPPLTPVQEMAINDKQAESSSIDEMNGRACGA